MIATTNTIQGKLVGKIEINGKQLLLIDEIQQDSTRTISPNNNDSLDRIPFLLKW
ncbi:hypothetical protein [Bacillus thuringiensis]|uniref:hypothetical protein n=1 Tax=Bacillus thuringiensis TaxID=1428 RepID=UPI00159667A0|nr:hypothetical protein [Bacillus thuringiensis]